MMRRENTRQGRMSLGSGSDMPRATTLAMEQSVDQLKKQLELERFSVRVAVATSQFLLDQVMRDYNRPGVTVMICKLHQTSPDSLDNIGELFRMRRLLTPVLEKGGASIVKTSTTRYFTMFPSAERAVLAVAACCDALLHHNARCDPALALSISFGLETGDVLLIPGDMYGDAVNVASKLAEDIAEAGEVLVLAHFFAGLRPEPLSCLSMEVVRQEVHEVSGVELEACHLSLRVDRATHDRPLWMHGLTKMELPKPARNLQSCSFEELAMAYEQPSPYRTTKDKVRLRLESVYGRRFAVVGTDLSGFTRLVRKHGIMHFLQMIVVKRALVCPIIARHNGTVIGYEGDNIFAIFQDPSAAIDACHETLTTLEDYNKGRDEDTQLIAKLGCNWGVVYIHNGELLGEDAELGEWLAEDVGLKMTLQVSDSMRTAVPGLQTQAEEAHMFRGKLTKRFSIPGLNIGGNGKSG